MLSTRKRDRAPKPDRGDEFATWKPRPRAPAGGSPELKAALDSIAAMPVTPRKPEPKTPERKSQAIRDSARGEECTVRLPGVCTFNPEHTIWSHAPLQAAGKGRSIKAVDEAGAYCCTSCDAAADGQVKLPEGLSRADVLLAWFMGHMRSLVRLKQKGLL